MLYWNQVGYVVPCGLLMWQSTRYYIEWRRVRYTLSSACWHFPKMDEVVPALLSAFSFAKRFLQMELLNIVLRIIFRHALRSSNAFIALHYFSSPALLTRVDMKFSNWISILLGKNTGHLVYCFFSAIPLQPILLRESSLGNSSWVVLLMRFSSGSSPKAAHLR